jgi:hypothetical protein
LSEGRLLITQDYPSEKASVNDSETPYRQRRVGLLARARTFKLHLSLGVSYKKQNLGDVRYDEGGLVINDFKL